MHDHARVEPESTLYLAGERVVAGSYRQLEAKLIIHLDEEDFLPAGLDGHVACYVRIIDVEDLFVSTSAVVEAKSRGQEKIDV